MTTVSVIISTKDRAQTLRQTIDSLRTVQLPASMSAELVVVDNHSSDDTVEVARSTSMQSMPTRVVVETAPGVASARNRGVREAKGEVLLFTDDDVRLPADWLIRMTAPVLQGQADIVQGGVRIAPHLLRSWMGPVERGMFASTERLRSDDPEELVSANLAVSRRVFEKVPQFDPELGPGRLGFAEDTLFGMQARLAGMRLVGRMDCVLEHHFDPSRMDPPRLRPANGSSGHEHRVHRLPLEASF